MKNIELIKMLQNLPSEADVRVLDVTNEHPIDQYLHTIEDVTIDKPSGVIFIEVVAD